MLRHETSLKKFKKSEIISSIFFNHNGITLEINYKKKAGKITNMCRMNNMLLNNYWFNKETKGEIKNYLKTNENGNTTYQNLWDAAKAILRGKFMLIQAYHKKQEKSQINKLTPKGIRKRRTKPKVCKRKNIGLPWWRSG